MLRQACVLALLIASTLVSFATAQEDRKQLPREDVIEVPAVGEGLWVSNVFQTNMVLQRDKPLPVWGWATAGQTVTVSFAGQTQSAIAGKDRSWKVTLSALQANTTPQSMTIEGDGTSMTLENILIGDVWILGGQSNMEFPLERVENGQLEIISANNPLIRVLTVPAADGPDNRPGITRLHEWSGWFGRHFRKGDWDVCTPQIARELSAIGYVFARRLQMASQVPIGVIDASRGGTTVETWTPDAVLRKLDSEPTRAHLTEWDAKVEAWDPEADLASRVMRYEAKVAKLKKEGKTISPNEVKPTDLRPGPRDDQNRPGNCYASMIHPISGLAVKGAIFHQGYNNCFNGTTGAIMYRDIFPEMIRSWRAAFNDPEMPFGILSLCTEGEIQTLENYSEKMSNPGPYIREAQYETFLEFYKAGDKNIGFTSTYDLRRRWYHPQLKLPAGERIARWALATQYGFDREIRWKPPIVQSYKAADGKLHVQFDETVGAVDNGGPILGFAVAGDDRKFHPATANYLVTGKDDRGRPRTDQRVLVLSSPMVPEPTHYRYAWGRSPLGNLQAARNTDIPVGTQRSDDWPMENIPLGVLGEDASTTNPRQGRREIQEALRKLDKERAEFLARELLEGE